MSKSPHFPRGMPQFAQNCVDAPGRMRIRYSIDNTGGVILQCRTEIMMAVDIATFRWDVPVDGYQWLEARLGGEDEGPPQWVLTEGIGLGSPYRRRRYAPLAAEPALFRIFVGLDFDDRAALLGFANKYGLLGIHQFLALEPASAGQYPMGTIGESHSAWINEILDMRWAVQIQDLVGSHDAAGLRRFITYREELVGPTGEPLRAGGWGFSSHPEGARKSEPIPRYRGWMIDPVANLFVAGNVFIPATFLVQRWINDKLNEHAAPRLLYNLDLGKQVLQIVPKDLLGAMWFQLAQAIAGNRNYRTCRECSKWFEISAEADGRSARKLFCSDPCKSRDYRRRKDRVRELKAERKSVPQIVKQLHAEGMETDSDTVKKWTASRKE